jgi:hypothetical protein
MLVDKHNLRASSCMIQSFLRKNSEQNTQARRVNMAEFLLSWPRGLRRVSATARLLGLWFRIPSGACTSTSSESCVLSGIGICDGPNECVCVCVSLSVVKYNDTL